MCALYLIYEKRPKIAAVLSPEGAKVPHVMGHYVFFQHEDIFFSLVLWYLNILSVNRRHKGCLQNS